MAPLPFVNAALFALQLLVNAKQDAFSPATPPNATTDIPLAPAPYAFFIWLIIYAFAATHVFTDCFRRELSLYATAATPTRLRLAFTASCVLSMLWIVLNNWLQWINVATLDLALLAASLAPIYWSACRGTRVFEWRRFLASELAIRLYFSWVCAATLLCVTMSLQDLRGAYLPFETYAFLLAVLVVVALCGVVYVEDPVVGVVATWALVGLAQRTDVAADPTLQHTNELLRSCAMLAAPILSAMIVVAAVRQRVVGRKRAMESATDLEMAKPGSSYHSGIRYGAAAGP